VGARSPQIALVFALPAAGALGLGGSAGATRLLQFFGSSSSVAVPPSFDVDSISLDGPESATEQTACNRGEQDAFGPTDAQGRTMV